MTEQEGTYLDGIVDTWRNEKKVLPNDVEWMIRQIKWLSKAREQLLDKVVAGRHTITRDSILKELQQDVEKGGTMGYEITVTVIYKGVAETKEQLDKFTKEIDRQANNVGLVETTLTTEVKEERFRGG